MGQPSKFKIPRVNKYSQYPSDEKGWANLISKLHDTGLRERKQEEFNWALNIAYYLGFQHLQYNQLTGDLIRNDDLSEEFIINRIAPFVETRVAKLTRGKPIPSVTPDKFDPRSIQAAKLNESVFKHYWKVQDRDEKEFIHALLLVLMGSAFKKIIWNPNTGEYVLDNKFDKDKNLMLKEDGTEDLEKIFMGQMECEIKSNFSVIASPNTMHIDQASWIIERKFMAIEEILEIYPEVVDKDIEELITTCTDRPTQYESFINRLQSPIISSFGIGNYNRAEETPEIQDHRMLLVKEFWKKPCKLYPNGIWAVVIGNKLVKFQDWPYAHMKYPYIKTDDKKNPFGFYGISTVTRLIPIQKHYNQSRTHVAKNASLMCNGKWLVPRGSGIIEDAITDEEGEVIEYNSGHKPEQAAIMPLPNYLLQSEERCLQDFRDASGEREATNLPYPGLTAAVALQEAAAQSNEILGPIVANIEEGIEREGELILSLANQFYTDMRKIKIVGDDNAFMVLIDKTDLFNQTDITIKLDSGLWESKAANKQTLIDLWDRRVVTDPQVFLKAFMHGRLDYIVEADNKAELVVIEDIEMIKNGAMPEIRPFDNHILFIKMLSQFIQTPEFRRMPPDRQQIAMMSLQAHLKAVQPQQAEDNNPAAVGTPFGSQVVE